MVNSELLSCMLKVVLRFIVELEANGDLTLGWILGPRGEESESGMVELVDVRFFGVWDGGRGDFD